MPSQTSQEVCLLGGSESNQADNKCQQSMGKFFCMDVFLFVLGLYLGGDFLEVLLKLFNCIRSCQTAFKWLYILHSHQQCIMAPVSPHSCQHLLLSYFDSSQPGGCEAAFHCGLDLSSPAD